MVQARARMQLHHLMYSAVCTPLHTHTDIYKATYTQRHPRTHMYMYMYIHTKLDSCLVKYSISLYNDGQTQPVVNTHLKQYIHYMPTSQYLHTNTHNDKQGSSEPELPWNATPNSSYRPHTHFFRIIITDGDF